MRDDDGVRGFVNECAHNALPLNIGSNIYTQDLLLHCDHHYAVFRFADGHCTDGACKGDALLSVPLEIKDAQIIVGAARD